MVTVVIPALNEESTIAAVLRVVKNSPLATEIIVIDDKSKDRTVEFALAEGARVLTSTCLGKGASMREGLLSASNEIVVYLDADIVSYPSDILEKLTIPIIDNEADFVKSTFQRQAGRVTELVAKPLLSILLPELSSFAQPLSGMIAGRTSILKKVEFENDYGVDIGLLIDVHNLGARIKEVNIGSIENRMQKLEQLGKMSREVSRAILKRIKELPTENLANFRNIRIIRDQMDFAIKESVSSLNKMVVFDMDHTILKESFIRSAAQSFGFMEELNNVSKENYNPAIRTKHIAKLLKGKNFGQLIELIDSIPVIDDVADVVSELKKKGYICGIISDSYDCVTNHLKNKLGFDFSLANELEFSHSIATGEVKIPSFYIKNADSSCEHDHCKSNVLRHITAEYNVPLKSVIVVGDAINDLCMLRLAGIGVAFCSSCEELIEESHLQIHEHSFSPLLDIAK